MISFSDGLGILGALGLGAMLDAAVKPAYKERVSAWLERAIKPKDDLEYPGSILLDKIFGSSVLSWYSIPRYVVLSVSAIGLSYIIAVLTSPPEVIREMWIFRPNASTSEISILLVCLIATIVGDVFSYAQTRLFVRAIDKSRSGIVSAGLLSADIIVSLGIFFFTFSFARLICYLIVIYSGPEQYLTRTEYYLPEVLSAGLSAAKIESVGEKEPASQFAVAISNARSEPALASVSELQKDGLSSLVMDERSLRHVQFETQRTCVKNNRSEITASLTHIDNTLELFESAAIEYSKRVPMTVNYNSIMTDMERNFYEDAMNAMKSEDPDECIIEVTSVETMITPQAYIASAGPYNAWSAGFERTLFDAYQVVGFKLAPYISFDPYRSLQDYFLSLRAMLQNSILGATTVPYDQYILSEYFSDPVTPPNGSVNVPFTPMVASSLTTSVFLSIYMAAILVASIRRKILRLFNIILPTFEYKLAVFSSISIALVTAFIVAWLAFWLAQLIWRLALGYL